MNDDEYLEFPDEVPEGYAEAIEEEGVVPDYDPEEMKLLKKRKELEIRAARQEKKMEQRSKVRSLRSSVRSMKREEIKQKFEPILSPSKRIAVTLKKTGAGFMRMGQAYSESAKERHGGEGQINTGTFFGTDKGEDKFDMSLGKSNNDKWNFSLGKSGGGGSLSLGSMRSGGGLNLGSVISKPKPTRSKKRKTTKKKKKTSKKKTKRKK